LRSDQRALFIHATVGSARQEANVRVHARQRPNGGHRSTCSLLPDRLGGWSLLGPQSSPDATVDRRWGCWLTDFLETVTGARWLVGVLGEAAAPPWWRSQASLPTGQRILARLFPRTALAASLQTTGRAALIEHDARIGRHGVFHLFRLPVADEAAWDEFLRGSEAERVLRPLATLESQDQRLAALRSVAARDAPAEAIGPQRAGSIQELRRGRALGQVCALYAAGFAAGRPVYPYLDAR